LNSYLKAYTSLGTSEPASKEELLVEVYERLLEKLRLASLAIKEGEVKQKAELLSRITDAITILKASLDMENGGEIAKSLDAVYAFCLDRLLKANLENDAQAVNEVIEVLTPIYEGYKEVAGKGEADGK